MTGLSYQPLNTTPFKAAPAPQSTLAAPLIEKGTESDWFRDFQRITSI